MKSLYHTIFAIFLIAGICCAGCSRDSNKTVAELNKKAITLLQKHQFTEAVSTIDIALKKAEKEYGAEHSETAKCLETMGLICSAKGDRVKAESSYKRALAITKKISGNDSIEAAKIINNLAGLYYAEKKYTRAAGFFKQSLAIVEKKFSADDPRVETIQKNIETCEALGKGEKPATERNSLSGKGKVKDIVPAQVKQAMLSQLAKQNIFVSKLKPQPPIRIDDKGMIFPYSGLKKVKGDDSSQEVVVLFAAVKDATKQHAYIFQQSRIVAYQAYTNTINEGGIELLKKKLIKIFPGLYS